MRIGNELKCKDQRPPLDFSPVAPSCGKVQLLVGGCGTFWLWQVEVVAHLGFGFSKIFSVAPLVLAAVQISEQKVNKKKKKYV